MALVPVEGLDLDEDVVTGDLAQMVVACGPVRQCGAYGVEVGPDGGSRGRARGPPTRKDRYQRSASRRIPAARPSSLFSSQSS